MWTRGGCWGAAPRLSGEFFGLPCATTSSNSSTTGPRATDNAITALASEQSQVHVHKLLLCLIKVSLHASVVCIWNRRNWAFVIFAFELSTQDLTHKIFSVLQLMSLTILSNCRRCCCIPSWIGTHCQTMVAMRCSCSWRPSANRPSSTCRPCSHSCSTSVRRQ
jgi:hypothetical protein